MEAGREAKEAAAGPPKPKANPATNPRDCDDGDDDDNNNNNNTTTAAAAAITTAAAAAQPPHRPQPAQRDPSPTLRRDASHAAIPPLARKRSAAGLTPSLSSSVSASPQTSRNTSPTRPSVRPQEPPQTAAHRAAAAGIRSRKNSHDASPVRPMTAQSSTTTTSAPSAAAIQRALSAASVPQLQPATHTAGPVTDAVSRLPRSARAPPVTTDARPPASPSFSPRVKSPGPSAPSSRRNSIPRKLEHTAAPPIMVQDSTPPNTAVPAALKTPDGPGDGQSVQTPKPTPRGPSGPKTALETVQEATPPAGNPLASSTDESFYSMNSSQTRSSEDGDTPTAPKKGDDAPYAAAKTADADADASKPPEPKSKKEQPLTLDQNKAKLVSSKSAPPTARAKQTDSTRNMTVETETVASIPQSALSADRSSSQRGGDGLGSVRLKPSNETIRPRKERKRNTRKAPSVHNGTASSKADIFEARVASQVDEANSSDSDETFVYESNPPEPQLRAHRNHSRTPSVTSIHSQSDRRLNIRNNYDHRVAGKRSMKFSNNPYSVLDSPTDDSLTSGPGSGTGTGTIRAHHPRNISRFGRTIGSNSSLYNAGEDSPFTQASKLRANLAAGTHPPMQDRLSSRPNTPASNPKSAPANIRGGDRFGPWRKDGLGLRQYGLSDEGEDGSDERTPLVGTVRTPRRYARDRRRQPHTYDRERGGIYNIRQGATWGRASGLCLCATILLLVLLGASGVLVTSNRGLEDVYVESIRNVLASEQEIMLDLVVAARNPNWLGVSVAEMDLNLFAKSRYVSTSTVKHHGTTPTATPEPRPPPPPPPPPSRSLRSRRPEHRRRAGGRTVTSRGAPWQDKDGRWHDGDDDGDGDDEGLEGDSQTMLLGRVFTFDQPLYFEGSLPFRHRTGYSTGEFRLAKPGNKTESGGSARWERVLGHPLELILRGVLKYQLPVSGRAVSAAVRGSVLVHPEEGLDREGRMRTEPVVDSGGGERWEWIEHGDAEWGRLEGGRGGVGG